VENCLVSRFFCQHLTRQSYLSKTRWLRKLLKVLTVLQLGKALATRMIRVGSLVNTRPQNRHSSNKKGMEVRKTNSWNMSWRFCYRFFFLPIRSQPLSCSLCFRKSSDRSAGEINKKSLGYRYGEEKRPLSCYICILDGCCEAPCICRHSSRAAAFQKAKPRLVSAWWRSKWQGVKGRHVLRWACSFTRGLCPNSSSTRENVCRPLQKHTIMLDIKSGGDEEAGHSCRELLLFYEAIKAIAPIAMSAIVPTSKDER